MLIAALIVSAVLLIALGIWVHLNFLRCRHTRTWVKKIEAATTDEKILSAGSYYTSKFGYGHHHMLRHDRNRERAAEQKYEDACLRRNEAAEADRVKAARAKLDAETDPLKRLSILADAHDYRRLSHPAFAMTQAQITQLIRTNLETVLSRIDQGTAVEMHDYTQLADRGIFRRLCSDYGVTAQLFPPNWDDLVVERIPSPTVKDFRNTAELSAGEVRLLAAEALREQDRKKAKLVLAYCLIEREVLGHGYENRSRQVIYPHLMQVTEPLVAQLIVMVEAMEGNKVYSQQIKLSK